MYVSIYITAIGLTPGGGSAVHIYTQTIHRITQFTNYVECGPCPVFARYALAFALQLRKKHGKTSVRVAGECQLAKSIQYSLMKAFPGSFVVCFLLHLGHAIGFLRWEMWYVPIQHNTHQCGKMFVAWPVIEIMISLCIIHYMGAYRGCHFQHVLLSKCVLWTAHFWAACGPPLL
jgi:hypothetical protein